MKEIVLTGDKVVLVDDNDFEEISKYKWNLKKIGKNSYVTRNQHLGYINGKKVQKTVYLHRIILNATEGMLVDHINGNGLDNRRSNLRLCNPRQNLQNFKHLNKTSKYPGVSWSKRAKKWRSEISIKGKGKFLGYFDNEKEAAKIYEKAVRELCGHELICKIKREVFHDS